MILSSIGQGIGEPIDRSKLEQLFCNVNLEEWQNVNDDTTCLDSFPLEIYSLEVFAHVHKDMS